MKCVVNRPFWLELLKGRDASRVNCELPLEKY